MTKICSKKKNLPMIYWIRNDIKMTSDSKERIFLNKLQKNLSHGAIKREISMCKPTQSENCRYISRTVYKYIPELRKISLFDSVYDLFSNETDKAILRGWKDGQAHKVIIDTLRKQLYRIPSRAPDVKSNWNIFLEASRLIYVKSPCSKRDTKHTFSLHIFPKNKGALPKGRAFKNMDFHFNGLVDNGVCIEVQKLPNFEIRKIDTGQYSTVYDENRKRSFVNHWKAFISVK
jgi:hypothetical protein